MYDAMDSLRGSELPRGAHETGPDSPNPGFYRILGFSVSPAIVRRDMGRRSTTTAAPQALMPHTLLSLGDYNHAMPIDVREGGHGKTRPRASVGRSPS